MLTRSTRTPPGHYATTVCVLANRESRLQRPPAEPSCESFLTRIPSEEEKALSIETNKATVKRFMGLLSKTRLDEAFELLSDDVTWSLWGNGPAAGIHDKEAMRAVLNRSFGYFAGPLQWTPIGLTAEEERVAVEAATYGCTRGGFEYRNKYHTLFRIKDGKIFEIKEMFEESPVQALMTALEVEAYQPKS